MTSIVDSSVSIQTSSNSCEPEAVNHRADACWRPLREKDGVFFSVSV